jgi:hypothetical protein
MRCLSRPFVIFPLENKGLKWVKYSYKTTCNCCSGILLYVLVSKSTALRQNFLKFLKIPYFSQNFRRKIACGTVSFPGAVNKIVVVDVYKIVNEYECRNS